MRVLAIGIHPDDIEIGCGGTVVLAARQGHEVTLVDLSDGSASSNGTAEERAAEALQAAKITGARARINLGLPDGGVRSEDGDQLRVVVKCIREHRPELMLIPDADDPHPDHASGGVLTQRALFLAGVHGFEPSSPAWRTPLVLVYPGRRDFEPAFVFDVSETFETKIQAIRAHASQVGGGKGRKPTPLNRPDFLPAVEARARVNGRRIGCLYGEPFRALSPVRVSSFALFGG